MPLNEIEVLGTSLSFQLWDCRVDSMSELIEKSRMEVDQFSLEPECPGLHDLDHDGGFLSAGGIFRGSYSGILPFEVEHLVDGISAKSLLKRIEACEFIIFGGRMITMGKPGPAKGLSVVLSSLTGYGVAVPQIEFQQLQQFSERLTAIRSIGLVNPKDKEVRTARLAGAIENYSEYNVIDPKNHDIKQVSGLIESPLGPMTVTVSNRAKFRIGVRRGFILTTECLEWLIRLVFEGVKA